MSNPTDRNHFLLLGPTSTTMRNTNTVFEGNTLQVIQKREVEGYQRTRLSINFNDKNEPVVLTVEARMVIANALSPDELLRFAHAVAMAQPPGSITEMPFEVRGDGTAIMRVTKPYVMEITQAEADGIVYYGHMMVQEYDAKNPKRTDDGSRE